MANLNGIKFKIIPPRVEGNVFYASITSPIQDKMALFKELYDILDFPGYFGFNWDALNDCLRDFCWINSYEIILAHEVLPSLSIQDFVIYLDILRDAIALWKKENEHSFEVWFNYESEAFIKSLCS